MDSFKFEDKYGSYGVKIFNPSLAEHDMPCQRPYDLDLSIQIFNATWHLSHIEAAREKSG